MQTICYSQPGSHGNHSHSQKRFQQRCINQPLPALLRATAELGSLRHPHLCFPKVVLLLQPSLAPGEGTSCGAQGHQEDHFPRVM